MRLEQIAQIYGMVDHYDMNTGRIYHLSEARENESGTLTVPVSVDGVIIGFTHMEKPQR